MVVNPDTCFVAPFMKGPDGGIVCTTGYLANQAQKRFIDSYFKSIYPESFGRAWTLGGPPVPPSLVRRSGSPDLLVRSDREFSAVEGMPLESSLSKASQKSNTTERKKRQGQLGGGLGLPVKIPDDAYGADSNVYSRSLRQIGIGARSLLSGTLDGLSLGLAKPGTTLSDYLGLPKPEKGTPEELVGGLIRGAADMAPAIYSWGAPKGTIALWSGTTADIPTGWELCNGQAGTKDLRNRFVVGAGGEYKFHVQNYKEDLQTVCGSFAGQNSASKAKALMAKGVTEPKVKAGSAMNTFSILVLVTP